MELDRQSRIAQFRMDDPYVAEGFSLSTPVTNLTKNRQRLLMEPKCLLDIP